MALKTEQRQTNQTNILFHGSNNDSYICKSCITGYLFTASETGARRVKVIKTDMANYEIKPVKTACEWC